MQFNHHDFEKGMQVKSEIERLMTVTQVLFTLAFLWIVISLIRKSKNAKPIAVIVFILFISKFINPMSTHYDLYKCQKQMFL